MIAYAANFLDETYPLQGAQHRDAVQYRIVEGAVEVQLENGETTGLANPAQFMGYLGEEGEPSGILLKHNGLHIEIQIDRGDSIGKNEKAGVKDILVESALTTIQDCEDSIAAVDADDKVIVYGNWLGLMSGKLVEEFNKGDQVVRRTLNPDRIYKGCLLYTSPSPRDS